MTGPILRDVSRFLFFQESPCSTCLGFPFVFILTSRHIDSVDRLMTNHLHVFDQVRRFMSLTALQLIDD